MIDSPENELIIRAQCGDRDAIAEVVSTSEWVPRSISKAMTATIKDASAVEDVQQEGMLALVECIADYDPKFGTKFSTFAHPRVFAKIYKAVYTCSVVKKYWRPEVSLDIDESLSAPAHNDDCDEDLGSRQDALPSEDLGPEELAHLARLRDAVERAMRESDKLTDMDRQIIRSRFLSEEPQFCREIGKELGRSHEAIRQRLKKIEPLLPELFAHLKDAA